LVRNEKFCLLITVGLEDAGEINLAIRAGGACGFGLGKCGDL
jgi:hypothetical protein